MASTPEVLPEVRTVVPGKARASSSAVRDSPTTAARSFVPWQCGQSKVAAGRAHQRQAGTREPPGPGVGEMPSGPAHTAQRAMATLRSTPVDLLLLDLNLPDMNGLELTRALRAAGIGTDVLVVTSARDLDPATIVRKGRLQPGRVGRRGNLAPRPRP